MGLGALQPEFWSGLSRVVERSHCDRADSPSKPGAAPGQFLGFSFQAFGSPRLNFAPSTADSFVTSLLQGASLTNFIIVTNVFTDVSNVPPCSVTNEGVQPFVISVTLRSNVVKGAVFVGVPSNFARPQIGFTTTPPANNPIPTASYQEASVLISVNISNAVTGVLEPAYIRVVDTLASNPALRGVIPNDVGCGAVTDRPVDSAVDRQNALGGTPGNHGFPEPNFFTSSASDTLLPPEYQYPQRRGHECHRHCRRLCGLHQLLRQYRFTS